MSGRFHVAGTFYLPSVGLFAVHGAVVAGVVRVGDLATAASGFRARVHGVEFVRLSGRREDIALTFRPVGESELAQWQGRTWPGAEVALTDAGAE